EEGVEHTPREGAVRSTTLQGQRHRLLRTRPGQATGLAGMAASAAGLRAVLPDDAVMSRGLGHGGSSNAAGPVAVRADRADRVLGDQGNRTLRVCPRKQLYAGEHACQRVVSWPLVSMFGRLVVGELSGRHSSKAATSPTMGVRATPSRGFSLKTNGAIESGAAWSVPHASAKQSRMASYRR